MNKNSMNIIGNRKQLWTTLAALVACCWPCVSDSHGQLLNEDFDTLPVGTAPDDGLSAGCWQCPQDYIQAGVSEGSETELFTIVPSSTFDPQSTGNSFRMNSDAPINERHVTCLFNTTVTSDFVFQFDTFVPQGGGTGAIYLAADHGGGGWEDTIDRGPQIAMFANGDIHASQCVDPHNLVGQFEFEQWLRFELHVDLQNQTYDLYFGPRDGDLEQIAEDNGFRSCQIDMIDRVSFAHFGEQLGPTDQYFDNLVLVVIGDVNQDGVVDLLDVNPFINVITSGDYQAEADVNQDGEVNLLDVDRFVELLVGG